MKGLLHAKISPEGKNRGEKIGAVDDIPPLPAIATRIIDGCINEQVNNNQLAELIKHDLALTK